MKAVTKKGIPLTFVKPIAVPAALQQVGGVLTEVSQGFVQRLIIVDTTLRCFS